MNTNRVEITFKMLILLLISVYLNGCQAGIIYDPDSFRIDIPPGWETKRNFMDSSLAALSPIENQNDRFQENFVIAVEQLPFTIGINKYFDLNLENIRKEYPSFKLMETGVASVSGKNAKWAIYTCTISGVNIKTKIYVVIKRRKGYAIAFASTARDYSRYTTLFEDLIESFTFI